MRASLEDGWVLTQSSKVSNLQIVKVSSKACRQAYIGWTALDYIFLTSF
jgi:hypothetical protein